MADARTSGSGQKSEKICFVVSPIGDEGSEIRKRADSVLKYVITPAVAACGYKPFCADEIAEPGMITSQVIEQIFDAPMVVADLTDRNPNVYYELALRHVLRRPLVQIIKKGEVLPFDVAGMRTIPVDLQDPASVDESKRDIEAQVRSLEADPSKLQTPISVSLDVQELRQSKDLQQRSMGEVIAMLSSLQSSVGTIEQRFRNPDTQETIERLRRYADLQRQENEQHRSMEAALLKQCDELRNKVAQAEANLMAVELANPAEKLIVLTDQRIVKQYMDAGWVFAREENPMFLGMQVKRISLRWPKEDPPMHPYSR